MGPGHAEGMTSWLWQPTDHQHRPQTQCEPGAVPALWPRERGKSRPGLESGSHPQPRPPRLPPLAPEGRAADTAPGRLWDSCPEHCLGSQPGRRCQRSRRPRLPWRLGCSALARAVLTLGHASLCSPVTRVSRPDSDSRARPASNPHERLVTGHLKKSWGRDKSPHVIRHFTGAPSGPSHVQHPCLTGSRPSSQCMWSRHMAQNRFCPGRMR